MELEDRIAYRTLAGTDAALLPSELEELRAGVRGGVSRAGDPSYERARLVWNGMVDRHPALVAHCMSTADVRSAVRFARDRSMLLSVRGGGHHIAGNAVGDGALALDLSLMRGVRVDPRQRLVRAGGGALLGDVDHEAQAFALATPLGINSTTGLGGLCLGGGFGWLTRKYGMTIDNLISADVVTATGELVVASAAENADLFWAIRGGGGNFGVVTSFELGLHRVGPLVYAGLVVYPWDQARSVLRAWRDFTERAPDELTAWVVMRKAPPLPFLAPEIHGADVVIVATLFAGEDLAAGERATQPLLRFGSPAGQWLSAQPYVAFQQTFDPMLAAGARNYWKTHDFEDLEDEALDVISEGARMSPGPACEVFLGQVGGAMGRVSEDATAYAGRNARWIMNIHGRWEEPSDDERVRSWARGIYDRAAPWATGLGYVNFLTADEAPRVASAYGDNYERLQELKERWDPENLFRMNHNIAPLAPRHGHVRRAPRPHV